MNTPPRPPRPIIDAMLEVVLGMMQDVYALNQTGDTWENILARAKTRLYNDLDAAARPPQGLTPAPPPVDYESEYFKLYNNVLLLCQILGIDTLRGVPLVGVIDMSYVMQDATALVARIRELQQFVKPPAGAHWGPDWNSVVYKINRLVKP